VVEGATKDGHHRRRFLAQALVGVVEPDGGKLDGVLFTVVQLQLKRLLWAESGGQFIDKLRLGRQCAVGGGVWLLGEGHCAQPAVMVGAEYEDRVGCGDSPGGLLPYLGIDGTASLGIDVRRDNGPAAPLLMAVYMAVAIGFEKLGQLARIAGIAEAGEGRWAMRLAAKCGQLSLHRLS